MVDSVAEINRPTKMINKADKKLAQFYNVLKEWSFLECQNSLWQSSHEMIHFQVKRFMSVFARLESAALPSGHELLYFQDCFFHQK